MKSNTIGYCNNALLPKHNAVMATEKQIYGNCEAILITIASITPVTFSLVDRPLVKGEKKP